MSGRPPALLVVPAAAAAGIVISGYLTLSHYQHIPLSCTASSVIDCGAVTSSSFSLFPGTTIPVALLGMGWFAVEGALAALALARPQRPLGVRLLVGWGIAGAAFVLYLVYAELVVIHRVCEWCTAVHVLVVTSLLASLTRLTAEPG